MDNLFSEAGDPLIAPTPEIRRAQRLLYKIDDNVRTISQRQEDLRQVRHHHGIVRPYLEVEFFSGTSLIV